MVMSWVRSVWVSSLHVTSFFFFVSSRRRHTRSDRDWSSDVCSSDLRLRLRKSNHPLAKVSDQQFLRLVLVGLQDPVVSRHEIGEHCVLSLSFQDDRLDRDDGAWDDRSQLMRHTARVAMQASPPRQIKNRAQILSYNYASPTELLRHKYFLRDGQFAQNTLRFLLILFTGHQHADGRYHSLQERRLYRSRQCIRKGRPDRVLDGKHQVHHPQD